MFRTHLRALMWKDFHHQGGFLVATAVVLVIPFVIALVALIVNQLGPHAVAEWIRYFYVASVADCALAVVLVAFFAGNAVAGERSDRSAEFTAYLPIGRKASVASKALVALGISAALLGIFMILVFVTTGVDPGGPRPVAARELSVLMATSGMIFGLAWLVSSFTRSATYAAASGLATPVCIGVTLGLLSEVEAMRSVDLGLVYLVLCPVIGLGGLIAGAVYYVRRVEP